MRWVLMLLLIAANPGCDDKGIVEPLPFILVGTVSDSSSGTPLAGVSVLRLFRVGDPEFQQDTTDSLGAYNVILGVGHADGQWKFEKTGYREKEFTLPDAAVKVEEFVFQLDVVLSSQ